MGAALDGNLEITHSTIETPIILANCDLARITFRSCQLPLLLLEGSSVKEINLDESTVHSDISLAGVTCDGPINMSSARIMGLLLLQGASLAPSSDVPALVLNGAEIGAGARLDDGFTCAGAIHMIGTVVSSSLSFMQASLSGDKALLILDKAEIRGDVFLSNGFECERGDRSAWRTHRG